MTDEGMEKKLHDETETGNLIRSIKENGGLIKPVILHRDKDEGFTTLEGNRRVASLRRIFRQWSEMNSKDPEPWMLTNDWTKIPAYERPDDMDDKHWDAYLCMEHGRVSTRSWDDETKAAAAQRLHDKHNMAIDDIAGLIGESVTATKRIFQALQVTREYLTFNSEDENPARYSTFHELLKVPGGSTKAARNLLFRVLKAGTPIDSKTVRQLPGIQKNPKSLAVLTTHLKENPTEAFDLALAALGKDTPSAVRGGVVGKMVETRRLLRKEPVAFVDRLANKRSEHALVFQSLFDQMVGIGSKVPAIKQHMQEALKKGERVLEDAVSAK